MSSTIQDFLAAFSGSLPQVVFAIVGLVLIRSRLRPSHPKACHHGTIGMTLILVNALWGALGRTWVLVVFAGETQDRMAVTNKLTVVGLVSFVLFSAALVFILVAILADRGPSTGSPGNA